jgi:hypothetical protein
MEIKNLGLRECTCQKMSQLIAGLVLGWLACRLSVVETFCHSVVQFFYCTEKVWGGDGVL